MKKFIVANWKMNPETLTQAKELFNLVAEGTKNIKNIEIIVCPPFVYLSAIQDTKYKIQDTGYLKGVALRPYGAGKIQLGGQNCFYETNGAFTGEISPVMLKNMGCEYVILGHSERRKYQKETDEIIRKKIESALSVGLKPIVCVDKLSQLETLKKIDNWTIGKLLVAYEPLECIGNGKACDPKDAEKMRIMIEKEFGRSIPILYGGSVNSQNAKNYVKTAGFSGLLIGGVSLKADEFVKIANTLIYS